MSFACKCVHRTHDIATHLWVGESSTEQAGQSRPYIPLSKYGDVEIIDQRRFDAISVTQEYIVHVDVVVDQGYGKGGCVGTDATLLGDGPIIQPNGSTFPELFHESTA
jgi:hypothetical protein